jgi:bisphosphoglycerate-independent phosphoglycerate mutase (AlkP superfamily)
MPLSGLQLMDFAPTILHLMGQPIPEEMQGQVMQL